MERVTEEAYEMYMGKRQFSNRIAKRVTKINNRIAKRREKYKGTKILCVH